MTEEIKKIIESQFIATMSTLYESICMCKDEDWNADDYYLLFCQIAFHVLFDTDYYLEKGPEHFKEQQFHIDNKAFFQNYEELNDRHPRNIYERNDIERYFRFCVNKGIRVLSLETEQTLCMKSGFTFRPFTRLELYFDIIRHIQNHASELTMRNQGKNVKHLIIANPGWKEMQTDFLKEIGCLSNTDTIVNSAGRDTVKYH
jgi:hypothetical protein